MFAGPPPTPATAASSPACVTADLRVGFLFGQGATGHEIYVLRVRNVSGRTCHTFGWFGVQLLGRRGHKLPTHSHRVTSDFFGPQPKRRVRLQPKHHGSFRITTTTGAGGHCVTAWRIRVIAPDDTQRETVKLGRQETIFACQHGSFDIAPIQPRDRAK
jgi:hypothetical protein